MTYPSDPSQPEVTIGQLVAQATRDLSTILRSEIALAKAEITVDVKKGAKGGAFFAVAAFFLFMSLIFLLHAAAHGFIALGLVPWLSYLCVVGLLLLFTIIFALVGLASVKRIKGTPKRAIASTRETIDVVRQSTS